VQSFCGGGGACTGGQSVAVDPPSIEMGPAHTGVAVFVACASHVQLDGQSLAAEQSTIFGEQCEVEKVMVMQTGGGGAGAGPPSSEEKLPPLPAQVVASSGSQVKPSPQSDATLQGSRYLGTQDRVVVVVQAGGVVGCGVAHFPPGGHGVDTVCGGQSWLVWVKHTIPDAQSLSELQGSGAHCEIVCGPQTGCWQVSPGAHAIAGQGGSTVET
jgi:hypothetical protein